MKTLMLTGDNPHTAAAIAAQVGIDAARGNLLPEDKLREVEARQADGSRVGMVGDGINDAPALARADIGFAMGAAGTDTAIETAGVALMDDDLRKLPQFVRLSRTTHAILVRTSPWPWASRRCSSPLPWQAKAPCGWRYSPTWAPACWWCSTVCDCCASVSEGPTGLLQPHSGGAFSA